MTTQTLIKKLGKVENELLKIKKGGIFPFSKKPISLKGIMKGANITDQDIKEAKKSPFKKVAP
jgi:hypothetical protein